MTVESASRCISIEEHLVDMGSEGRIVDMGSEGRIVDMW